VQDGGIRINNPCRHNRSTSLEQATKGRKETTNMNNNNNNNNNNNHNTTIRGDNRTITFQPPRHYRTSTTTTKNDSTLVAATEDRWLDGWMLHRDVLLVILFIMVLFIMTLFFIILWSQDGDIRTVSLDHFMNLIMVI
jgi:hypothetical protein